jgi:transposase
MFEKIRTLSQEGKRISEIARLLKISRTTVRKHLRHNTAPQYKVRETGARQDSVAEFASEIKNWLSSSPQLTDQEIFELLIGKGYSGSIRTLNRRLKAFRPLKTKERFFEQKYTAAEQAQFDFKEELKLQFKDGLKTGHLLVGTLPYSDRFYIKAFPFKNYQCFIEGVHAFFEFIGGLTVNVRIDNLSPCVSKVLKHGERK